MGQIFRPVTDMVTTTITKVMREGGEAIGDLSKKLGTKADYDASAIRRMDDFTPYQMTDARRRREDARGPRGTTQANLDVEFARQRREQLDALGALSIAEWRRRMNDGRTRPPESLAEQRRTQAAASANARQRADLIRRGLNPDFTAATHTLDGHAGGDWTDISGVGDSSINSSLGSQWKDRVPQLLAAVEAFEAAHPNVDLSDVNMDIFLP